MNKLNCWEIKECGREPGGVKTQELGICPAATDTSCNGMNDGTNGGRICWAVAGTLCGGEVQGEFAKKTASCLSCEVFKRIKKEVGPKDFKLMKPGQHYTYSAK